MKMHEILFNNKHKNSLFLLCAFLIFVFSISSEPMIDESEFDDQSEKEIKETKRDDAQSQDRELIKQLFKDIDQFRIDDGDSSLAADEKTENLKKYISRKIEENKDRVIKFDRLIPTEVVEDFDLNEYGKKMESKIRNEIKRNGVPISENELKFLIAFKLSSCKECYTKNSKYICSFKIIRDQKLNQNDSSFWNKDIEISKVISSKSEAIKFKLPANNTITFYRIEGKIIKIDAQLGFKIYLD